MTVASGTLVWFYIFFLSLFADSRTFFFGLGKKSVGHLQQYTFIYSCGAILMFIMELNRKSRVCQHLTHFSRQTSPTIYIATLLLFGGLTWTLCKENIREVYQVDKKTMLTALGIGSGIILLMTLYLDYEKDNPFCIIDNFNVPN